MNVVVTGAAGFIGSHVCERLVAAGERVIGIDAFDDYLYPAAVKRANATTLARLPPDRFRLVEADICDRSAIASVLTGEVDVVCHLAALAGVRPSIAEPLRYLRANIEGTGVIVECMRHAGLKRLVFASSSSVYGVRERANQGADVVAFREDDPCLAPASPYAATKRMNELQLATYRDLFGIGVFALRFFTVYGPRQRPDMAIAKFITAIAEQRPITVFGDGSSRRDYTFIDDVVAGTLSAIHMVQPGSYEIFNLGGTRTISLAELVAICERVVGQPAKINRQPDQPGDVPITYANIDRARDALGYSPHTTVDVGIARYWEWLQAQRRPTP
jgi:UDP-glucuronate 4-epimerase